MNYIFEVPKAFTPEFCQQIIAARKAMSCDPYDDIKYWHEEEGHTDHFNIFKQLEKTIEPHILNYLAEFKSLMDYSDMELVSYNVVRQALNHHDSLHYDTQMIHHGAETSMRPFVCMLYLNEGFEGGQCVFPVQKKVITPEAGKLVLFPASFMFPHMVLSVSSEERYSIRLTYSFKAPLFEMDREKWEGNDEH